MATTTEEPPKKEVKISFARAYELLCESMNKHKAHQQISRHFKAISGRPLPLYHIDPAIAEDDKVANYKLCFKACHDGNYSKLQGQEAHGKGDKRVDPTDTVIPPVKKETATPATTQEPPSEPDKPKVAPAKPEVKPVVAVTEDDTEATAHELANILRRLKGTNPAKAELDEERVGDLLNLRIAEFESDYDKALGDKVKKHLGNGAFPKERIVELFDELSKNLVQRIEFITPGGEVKTLDGLMHPQVPQVAAWLRAGVPVWIHSPAGSGKTQAARQIATLLEVEPYVVSVDPTLTVSKLMGYRNVANGDFVEGFIYKPYKHGGLLALDEIDTGDPGVIASANALLSNGHYLFPNNDTVAKHEKFYTLAMGNTKGMGAVAGYTARNRLDAATLDRFAIIEFKYDAGLESAIACGIGSPGAPWKCGTPATPAQQQAYVAWVQKVREKFGASVLISPRASINGCKALRAGIQLAEVLDALVFKLVTPDTIQRIKSDCGLPAFV